MNDPNGPVWFDGWYHALPASSVLDPVQLHWGHARSKDLVHWEHSSLRWRQKGLKTRMAVFPDGGGGWRYAGADLHRT